MKNELNLWLYTLFASGCITSMILYLMPDERSRQIAELGCSCIMIFALLMPLKNSELDDFLSALSICSEEINDEIALKQVAVDEINKEIIEEQFEEYILNEAESQNIKLNSVSVNIAPYEDGSYIPEQVFYYCEGSVPELFLEYIEGQLGVSKERQITYEDSGNHQ